MNNKNSQKREILRQFVNKLRINEGQLEEILRSLNYRPSAGLRAHIKNSFNKKKY